MYLYQTMKDSQVWKSAQKVWERGGAYAGCSAGAMILGREVPDFRVIGLRSISVFGLVNAVIIPHFDATPVFFKPLVAGMRSRLKDGEMLVGVDENTAMVGKPGQEWTVMGRSGAHVFTKNNSMSYKAGEKFSLGQQQ